MSLGINTKPSSGRMARSTGALKQLDRPIFITGLGRSGTTIIHTLFSTHPNTNWMSLLCGKFPSRPYLNRWLMRAIDIPLINIYLKWRFVPLENYDFWGLHYRGFFNPCRDLFASDVDPGTTKSMRKGFSQLLTLKRNRLLIKITGVPRISYLHAIFPDAKFVHVTRDGRAVAHSRMRTPFWTGWDGLNLWAGKMPDHYREEWERHQHSFVALAGIEWKTHLDMMDEVRRNYPHINIHEVKYEDFCADPVAQLREIAKFCELSWDARFENLLRQHYVGSENSKWQSDLTEEQKAILQDVLAERLVEQGYELSGETAKHAAVHSTDASLELMRRS
ncbi:MAG TPA: sulfotransferase [Terriglobales bacterium]|nr:sulfotransferase [Terriglobales bacterium]